MAAPYDWLALVEILAAENDLPAFLLLLLLVALR
jgi:hypothetical protein